MVKNSFCGPLMAAILKKMAAILNLWVANGFLRVAPLHGSIGYPARNN